MLCPCCSGVEYSLCCGRWLSELLLPPDPTALMRSRYVAYVQNHGEWLEQTWHPSSRPAGLALHLAQNTDAIRWQGLTILSNEWANNGNTGYVTYFARYTDTRPGFIYERSRFVYEDGRWYYVDGTFPALRRNDRCPCGSGKKNKKCCGQ
ncbi:SEC-C motif-containing protein [Izhakiella capsodis]|uniref:SEC-C motif-containing protein n=2 Tax=Izhakiella capsodis TaxID=1367852 RepID=A0A1I4Z8I8_9GAMM|nr:SEC-C motif-containing protein [Izhakiella capsodis]